MKFRGLGGILVHYVGAAIGVGVCLLVFNMCSLVALIISCKTPDYVIEDRVITIAHGIERGTDGTFTISTNARQALDERYAWSMLLDDAGRVIWEDRMPYNLPRKYTTSDIASFAKWYLNDYPVYCWENEYGLMVVASAPGSEWKYNVTMGERTLATIIERLPVLIVLNLIAILALALLLGWRMYRATAPLAKGINELAHGETTKLPERGVLRLLSVDINRASARLLAQRSALQKRDRTRTEWIAGVSHDIRTPLSLVQGNAAQIEADIKLPEKVRRKAALIITQSQRIGRLVSDLNLASKLEYELQPLRPAEFRPAVMLRAAAAEMLNGFGEERIHVYVDIPHALSALTFTGDETLLRRAVDNLIRNSITHNEGDVHMEISLKTEQHHWTITVSDDGNGLSDERLEFLSRDEMEALPSHGLGLVLVKQIARAHNGRTVFKNTSPGLQVTLTFPL